MMGQYQIPGTHDRQMAHAGVAANATANKIVLVAPFDCKLATVSFFPVAQMAHNDTNYCIFDVADADGDSFLAAPFSFNTAYGDLDAFEELSLDCQDAELDAGDVVVLEITQQAGGLAVPVFNTAAFFLAR